MTRLPVPGPAAVDAARSLVCPMCWAPSGCPCTVSGAPGDHLARYMLAEKESLISRDDLGDVIDRLVVFAAHVIVPEPDAVEYITVTPGPEMRAAALAAAGLPDLITDADSERSAPERAR